MNGACMHGCTMQVTPRFLLAGLLVYSGAGFLIENLWEGRHKMNRFSFVIVWAIFIVNFVWEFVIKEQLDRKVGVYLPGLLVVFVPYYDRDPTRARGTPHHVRLLLTNLRLSPLWWTIILQ